MLSSIHWRPFLYSVDPDNDISVQSRTKKRHESNRSSSGSTLHVATLTFRRFGPGKNILVDSLPANGF